MPAAPVQRSAQLSRRSGLLLLVLLLFSGNAGAQSPIIDIARQSIARLDGGMTSANIAIYGVTLGMSWGEARSILDRTSIPYIFQKGTSPVVYVPPQQSSFYFVLNPSSYDVIEMGVIGSAGLPLENQFLFDGQRWKLTTARTQFFGTEGEFIINEEGESFNFPGKGFVLKYMAPGSFRCVMVLPTHKPLTTKLRDQEAAPAPRHEVAPPPPPPPPKAAAVERPAATESGNLDEQFAQARGLFEEKRYSDALGIFKRLSEQNSYELLRIRSVYWMGECLYGMKDFRGARRQFERVLKETDIPDLRAPAMKMIGNCKKHGG
jgi:hypothetical protein